MNCPKLVVGEDTWASASQRVSGRQGAEVLEPQDQNVLDKLPKRQHAAKLMLRGIPTPGVVRSRSV